jgi:hypothetical protein
MLKANLGKPSGAKLKGLSNGSQLSLEIMMLAFCFKNLNI